MAFSRLTAFVLVLSRALLAAPAPRACAGGMAVGTFRLMVAPAGGGPALPIRQVNSIRSGQMLQYQPVQLPADWRGKARITLVLAPRNRDAMRDLVVLDARDAGEPAEWMVPVSSSLAALVVGPRGLDVNKVSELVGKNQELVAQLADYADQTAQVEALVQALAIWEQAPAGSSLDAALKGFSAQYGVSLPKLDPKSPTDQQATTLLRALLPAVSTYDPLTSQRSAFMQQSAGMAASVAGLFLGNTVGLAAGGTAMFQNLRMLLFPDTDFRSTIAQTAGADGLTLCSKVHAVRSRTRPAYLWAVRVPAAGPPVTSLAGSPHLPANWKSPVRLDGVSPAQMKLLLRARNWQLVSVSSPKSYPVRVAAASSPDSIELDLTQTDAPLGEYSLRGAWDWDEFPINGTLHLHKLTSLGTARVATASSDRLIEGGGRIPLRLEGADFQFVEKLSLRKDAHSAPIELTFERSPGDQALNAEVDLTGLARGGYRIAITQVNGSVTEVPITILQPHPRIGNLPVRVNLGEPSEEVRLEGTGLDRIERIMAAGAELELGPALSSRDRGLRVQLTGNSAKGARLEARMKVQGVSEPVPLGNAFAIVGPRPRIIAVERSLTADSPIDLRPDEIPSGSTASFAVRVEHIESTPSVELACRGEAGRTQVLRPGESTPRARLDFAGQDLLFLSVDPGLVGQSGCLLTATVETEATGRSASQALGRVIRVPRIDEFVLTDEKLGDNLYAGLLKGEELETIEKTGWDAHHGLPVRTLPSPDERRPMKQALKIALPWPAPAPHAPVFVWLRGESSGRATKARY